VKVNNKCVVIGLDGATFDLINPLIKAGKLPTIKKMMEEGAYGILKSTTPPLTGPAWVSFATGKNPGKHGCYDFELPRDSLDEIETISSKDINGQTFYEVLDREGKKCILINLPCSYPPRIDSVVIADFLTRGSNFVFPESLKQKVPELHKYRVVPKHHASIRKYIKDIRELERGRFECARKLFQEDWDFFFILFQGTDWIQHRIYHQLVAGEYPAAVKFYQELDCYIKWFTDNADGVPIMVMSDHGFRAYRKTFAINEWLMEEGYLKIKQRQSQSSTLKDRTTLKAPLFLVNHRWLFVIVSFFYRVSKRILPPVTPVIRVAPDTSSIAFSILSSANGNCAGIYINAKGRFSKGKIEAEDYERVRNEIIAKLEQLTDKYGVRVFSSVLRREDIYSGGCLNKAPDIFLFSEEYLICPFDGGEEGLLSNEHSPDGVFIAYGEDIKKGVRISDAEILDLAPTILHSMGLPIQRDMDGRVLAEIFKEGYQVVRYSIEPRQTSEADKIRAKIKVLREAGKI